MILHLFQFSHVDLKTKTLKSVSLTVHEDSELSIGE